MKSESDALDQFSLQKAQYVITAFQDNPVAIKIAKRKQLELMDWTTEEVDSAMQAYEQQQPVVPQDGMPQIEQPLKDSEIMQQQ